MLYSNLTFYSAYKCCDRNTDFIFSAFDVAVWKTAVLFAKK